MASEIDANPEENLTIVFPEILMAADSDLNSVDANT